MPPLLPAKSRFFSIILFILLHPITTAAQINWSNFPYKSRSCLIHYADLSSCPRTVVGALEYCLCNNYENWLTNVAACVKKEARDDLEAVYDQIVVVCASKDTPTLFSLDDFMAAAEAGTSTTSWTTTTRTALFTGTSEPPKQTQTSQTTTPTSTPEKEKGSGDGGLSTSDKIAIGIGVPVGVFGIIGAIATWWMCCRR